MKCPEVHSLIGVMQISRPKKHVYLLSSDRPFILLLPTLKVFSLFFGGFLGNSLFGHTQFYLHIKTFNKIMKGKKKERERMYKKKKLQDLNLYC